MALDGTGKASSSRKRDKKLSTKKSAKKMVTGKTSTSAEQLKAGSDVLRKLGISSHYEVSLNNPDYFQSEPSKEILEVKKFKDVETMKEQVLRPLNKDFAEDVHVLSLTLKYIRLKCIY